MTLIPKKITQLLPHRCSYLFLALLLLLVMLPLLITSNADRIAAGLINLAILLAAVAAIGRDRISFATAVLLAVPAAAFQVLGLLQDDLFFLLLSWTFSACFYFLIVSLLLRYVLLPTVMNADKLYGAGAIYLMLGIMWAYFYGIIQYFYPTAFAASGPPLNLYDLLYFSFTVLTTVGFGDIVPVHPVARGMTMLEQVVGVLYVAILIARLSSMYSTQER